MVDQPLSYGVQAWVTAAGVEQVWVCAVDQAPAESPTSRVAG